MTEFPARLKWIGESPEGRAWLERIPNRVAACSEQWGLVVDPPFENSFVSIVYPATRRDGSHAVLKLQYPHRESDNEHEALRLWNGDGAIRLLEYQAEHHALLVERCEPGVTLTAAGAEEALSVYSRLLPRLWIPAGATFRSLLDEAGDWIASIPNSWEDAGRPCGVDLVDRAVEALDLLRMTQGEQVLLHQDLHADNVLRAQREPWLVIDPKPLVGEREFSLAPIVRSAELGHSRADLVRRLDTLTTNLGLDRERARLWSLGQTVAWGFGGDYVRDHMESARWLAEA
jgi:streptomycin 6-kinase